MACQHLQLGISQAIQTLYVQNGTHHFPTKPIFSFDVYFFTQLKSHILSLFHHASNKSLCLVDFLKYSLDLSFLLYPY